MKKVFTLVGILLFCLSMNSFAGNYKLDQSKINAMIENATDISAVAAYDMNSFNGTTAQLDEKDPIIAFALATVIGYFGIHRLYLGTSPLNIVLYIVTGGGCGVVVAVDWIMLLLVILDKKDMGPYIDNPSFIMWKNQL